MPGRRILMGMIGRPHGVRGLVRVQSYASDPAALAEYGPLEDERGRRFVLRWRGEGIAELAEIVEGKPVPLRDRSAAERLVNLRLYLDRDRLPPPEEDEFYFADLIGLEAVTPAGESLGRVGAVHDYGAGASLEIGRMLLPFTRACVPEVDVGGGRIVVVPPVEVDVPPMLPLSPREGGGRSEGGEGETARVLLTQPSPPQGGEGFKDGGRP